MDLGLEGKTALVTGASEGIGSAVARKLADEGVSDAGASAFGAFVDLPNDAFVDAINGKLAGAALVVDGSKSVVI